MSEYATCTNCGKNISGSYQVIKGSYYCPVCAHKFWEEAKNQKASEDLKAITDDLKRIRFALEERLKR
jgi:uncharacterized Zn finger protein (UPF0148 family)